MEDKQKKIAGFVFCGIAAVALILVIVGMCIPVIADTGTNGTGEFSVGLFADEWELLSVATSPTLAIVGFVVAIIGVVAIIAYLALKLFLNKSIRILGILAAVVALVGGILIIVGGVMMALQLNTFGMSGKNLQMYDPASGIWLGGISGIVAGIAGFLAVSKKFN